LKRLLFLVTFACAVFVASPALAGPYLNSAAMLLREGFQSSDFLRSNLGDRELARVAHSMAEARVDAASHMVIPKEVEKAHPHVLLALAALERAADAASRGDVSSCLRHIETARGESRTFRALLEEQHLRLPTVRECSVVPQNPSPERSAQAARSVLRRACARLPDYTPGLASSAQLSR
jgi:hypothetical protein